MSTHRHSLYPISNPFGRGYDIGSDISYSNFPRFGINGNRGEMSVDSLEQPAQSGCINRNRRYSV